MNTEKEIVISDLKGKFTKDFDTFGKMVNAYQFRILLFSLRSANATGGPKQLIVKLNL